MREFGYSPRTLQSFGVFLGGQAALITAHLFFPEIFHQYKLPISFDFQFQFIIAINIITENYIRNNRIFTASNQKFKTQQNVQPLLITTLTISLNRQRSMPQTQNR